MREQAREAARSQGKIAVGFAAETQDLLRYAQDKLNRKDLDLVVANDISRADAGFASDTNAVTLVSRSNHRELKLAPKAQIAHAILDEILSIMETKGD